jgi:hypothetical protein
MDIWHKYAAVAYLAVFMDVTGHAYQETCRVHFELRLTSLEEDTANRKFGHRKPLPEHSHRS